MSGYQGAVGNAYSNARGYDGWMQNNFTQHSGMMPQMPQPQGGGGGQTFGGYVPQNPPPAGASASKPKGGSASSGPIKQLF
jgi:hypothetical protein